MRTIFNIGLALLIGVIASTTRADNPMPPIPEGGLVHIEDRPCVDIATGMHAYCYMSMDIIGTIYITMTVNGLPVEIRQIVDDGYVVVWSILLGELT